MYSHKLVMFGAVIAASLASAAPSSAITNGEADGDGHPNVGVLIAELRGGKVPICSGVLVSPTVFVTAGHCTAWLGAAAIERVWVSFDSTLDPAVWTIVPGRYQTDPDFGHDMFDLHDLGVVVLAAPVIGIRPAELPRLGLLDDLQRSGGRRASFTSVGYGYHARILGDGAPRYAYDGVRRTGTSPLASLTASWLRLLTGEPAAGGTCFGDSGGPQFVGDSNVVVAITSGGDAACAGIGWSYRLDTAGARNFLRPFVALP